MKRLLLSFAMMIVTISLSQAQDTSIDQSFLFDEGDIIIRAQNTSDDQNTPKEITKEDVTNAVNKARALLEKKPASLPKINIPHMSPPQKKSRLYSFYR